MTAVLHSPSHLPSPPRPRPPLHCTPNDGTATLLSTDPSAGADGDGGSGKDRKRERREEEQLPVLALLLEVVRKSLAGCRTEGGEEELRSMEIGWPRNVRHVAHVTFDRFHGFLGLPIEFEPEVPRRAPSASASVFGVSTESMQCSYDSRGNSIPTILLLMQRHLYGQGGLQAEGIFRINGENSQEEYVRDQLNSGVVPEGVDVHCLAGLIKAWFRELPTGVLDPLTPEQVMQCQSEDECAQLIKLLPPTESALLDWAINLMADVVQLEQQNKMNAHNVAMVFAPNMTQMADPLTALMYAVRVMNFLKTLILKTLKERHVSDLGIAQIPHSGPSDEGGHHSPQFHLHAGSEEPAEQVFIHEELGTPAYVSEEYSTAEAAANSSPTHENAISEDTSAHSTEESLCEIPACTDGPSNEPESGAKVPNTNRTNFRRTWRGRSSSMNYKSGTRKANGNSAVRAASSAEKSRGASILSRIDSKIERIEAWR